jgi:hypothetical protein
MALDQFGIRDKRERGPFFSAVCSELGKRENQRKKILRKAKGKPKQLLLPFSSPVKSR